MQTHKLSAHVKQTSVRDRFTHTHTCTHPHMHAITAGNTGKHPLLDKSSLREAAVWGLYFLELCLTVYISAGVC